MWQIEAQGQSDMEVHMKQRCVNRIPPCRKNGPHWHSSVLAEHFWRPNSGWYHGEAVGGAFQHWWRWCERWAMIWMALCNLSHQKIASGSSHCCKMEDYDLGVVYGAEHQLQCTGNNGGNIGILRSLSKWVPLMLIQKQKEHHIQICQDLLSQGWRWRFPGSIASLPVTSHGITTVTLWSSDMWIPHWRKSSRGSPQHVKWCALSFGIGKGWFFWVSWKQDK